MPLIEHQIALGRCLRAPGAETPAALTADALQGLTIDYKEAAQLAEIVGSSGFCFTRRVQRSWGRGRAARVARLTLSILPAAQRQRLVDDWVEAGGSTAFDPTLEAVAFLDFIEGRLTDPSHAVTLCRMERATYRASEAALQFRPPSPSLLDDRNAVLRAGVDADLVRFFAEPESLLGAVAAGAAPPPLSARAFPVLFAPALAGLVRAATDEEEALWDQLATPVAVGALSCSDAARKSIEELFSIGAVQLAGDSGPRTAVRR